jgi:hypothetical protein
MMVTLGTLLGSHLIQSAPSEGESRSMWSSSSKPGHTSLLPLSTSLSHI